MTLFPTYTPVASGVNYVTFLYSGAAGWAAQRLDFYTSQAVGDDSLRPVALVIPSDYTFDDNAGTRPATLTRQGHPLAWTLRNSGWNVCFASLSYTDPANPSSGDGAWQAGDTGSAIPDRDIAEADVLRAVQWLRENAATYQIDTTRIYLVADGDGATACLRALYQDDGTVFLSTPSPQAGQSHLVAGASLRAPRGGWRNLVSGDLREHVEGAAVPPGIPDSLDANLSTGRFLEGDTDVRPDARGVACRLYFDVADNWPQDYSPDVFIQIDDESAWFGEMLNRALAGTTLASAAGPTGYAVPVGKAFLRYQDWSGGLWTDFEKSAIRFYDLLADAGAAPVEDMVLDGIEDALRQIRVSNGYQTDIAHVSRVDDIPEEGYPQWPVILTEEADTSPSSDFNTVSQNQLRLVLYIVLAQEGRGFGSSRRLSSAIADTRKALQGAFLARTSYDGALRGLPIVNQHIISWERVQGVLADKPIVGARVTVEVHYRDLEADPYQPSTAL